MSSLPWFIDLAFQVPVQYCSLQRWTLLSPPNTSKTEHHFCFGPATSFFLELLVIALCSSLIACWTLSDLEGGGVRLPVFYLFAFITVHEVLLTRVLEWVAISFSGGPCFVRTLQCDLSVWGGPEQHDSQLHWVKQAPSPRQGCCSWWRFAY